jgi:hypothetical protein
LARPTASGGLDPLLLIASAAVIILFLATWAWSRRTTDPLLRFGTLRMPSFRVTNIGGSVYRMVISAVPFLLPLMVQVSFGWSAVRAGFFVLLLFVGNVLIKPATSPLLRRPRPPPISGVSGRAAAVSLSGALCPVARTCGNSLIHVVVRRGRNLTLVVTTRH